MVPAKSLNPMQFPRLRNSLREVLPALALIGLATLVVLAAASYARSVLAEVTTLTDLRASAYRGRLVLVETLSLFKDLETGARGYFITGRDQFLEPYELARRELPGRQLQLKNLMGEDLPHPWNWQSVTALMTERVTLADRLVQQRRNWRGRALPMEASALEDGRQVMERIRALFERLDLLQATHINDYTEQVLQARMRADRWAWVSGGFATLLVLAALLLLLREYLRRLQLAQVLQQVNAGLDREVVTRTAELAQANERLARFALEENRAVEDERRRLAREVHDQIGQVFTAIQLICASLPASAFPQGQARGLERALELGIQSTRRITAELRPPLLDDLGLEAAIQYLAQQVTAVSGLRVDAGLAQAQRLSPEQALTLYRVTQEALTNVQRHAHATRVRIHGEVVEAGYAYEIADDGVGPGAAPARPGALGLTGMRERVALIGGRCSIEAGAAGGTRVCIVFPLTAPSDPDNDHAYPAS